MKTIREVSTAFLEQLSGLYDSNEINSLCLIALESVTGSSSAKIKAFPELGLSNEHKTAIFDILARLKKGEPIQYIIGYTEFYGLKFKVNPYVLIPRPETEELVDWIIPSVRNSNLPAKNILDIGTGSGCIAISLKKNLTGNQLFAIDISSNTLQTAVENAELNGVNIKFIQDDMLNLTHQALLKGNYSVIVSNPPYVTIADKKQMHTNVTDFEPHTALFVPEDDPPIFYKAITDYAAVHMEKNGMLFFEINESYGKQIVELLNTKSFINIELKKDINNRDRMVKAVKSSS
jgi:release factor glutamine methyltransferase